MMSTHQPTRHSVFKRLEIASLLEEHLIAPFETLSETTMYPETLSVSEDRQFRNRGLTHIEDHTYEFFLEVEISRVSFLNDHKLALYREDLVSHTESSMKEDLQLQQKWLDCFPQEEKETKMELILEAFKNVITKYVMVGAGQYMRDYRRAHRLKKSAEHRKIVLQRKQALEEKKAAIPYPDIEADESLGKVKSHVRLQQYAEKFGANAFAKSFTKPQLQSLCWAYGHHANTRETKTKLVENILPLLQASTRMPHSYFTSRLQSQVSLDDSSRRITLRISTAN